MLKTGVKAAENLAFLLQECILNSEIWFYITNREVILNYSNIAQYYFIVYCILDLKNAVFVTFQKRPKNLDSEYLNVSIDV